MTRLASTEKDTQKAILEYLTLKGHFVWRNNSGAFKTERGGFYRIGAAGSPDIIGVKKGDGKFIGIEVKSGGVKPTALQEQFLKDINDRGGIGIVAYNIDQVMEIL
jgi:hypothetical protein